MNWSFIRKIRALNFSSDGLFTRNHYGALPYLIYIYIYKLFRRGFLFDHIIGKMLLVTLSLVLSVHRFSTQHQYPFIAIAVIIFVPHQSLGTGRNGTIE